MTASSTFKQIADYNPRRKSLVITNNSGQTVFISQDQTNITTSGFPVLVGQSISFTVTDGDEPELELYAQTLFGTADLRIIDRFGKVQTLHEMTIASPGG